MISGSRSGNPNPQPRQQADSRQPKPAPAMPHILQHTSSRADDPGQLTRIGAKLPYILQAGDLRLLPRMQGMYGRGSKLWPLSIPIRSRVLLLLSHLHMACYGGGAPPPVAAQQYSYWAEHLTATRAILRQYGDEPAGQLGGGWEEKLSAGMAMLYPEHHPPAHGTAAAGSWAEYGSPCVEYKEDALRNGMYWAPDPQHLYLEMYLGERRREAAAVPREDEGSPGGEASTSTGIEAITRGLHHMGLRPRPGRRVVSGGGVGGGGGGIPLTHGSQPAPRTSSSSSSSTATAAAATTTTAATKVDKANSSSTSAKEYAHRVVLWAVAGPPGNAGEEVLHLCHNMRCLNPQHLVWGSHSENRAATAEAYNEAMAREGRELWACGLPLGGAAAMVVAGLPPSPGAKGAKGHTKKGRQAKAKAK
ncbi:hypothetical protein PLESTM_001761400 [Pleodorina starrii]|nr:hypothetical protein PLESTM_001761400 [Pleodorina starrii]